MTVQIFNSFSFVIYIMCMNHKYSNVAAKCFHTTACHYVHVI